MEVDVQEAPDASDVDTESDDDSAAYHFPCCDAEWTSTDNTTNTVRCSVCHMAFHHGRRGLCNGANLTKRQLAAADYKYTCRECQVDMSKGRV